MKLKHKLIRWTLLGAVAVFVLSSLASIYTLARPYGAAAAGSPGAPILSELPSGDTNGDCTATIHKPTSISDAQTSINIASGGPGWGLTWNQISNASNPGGVVVSDLMAATSQPSASYISFSGVNPSYDAECSTTMFLVQSPTSPDDFYGLWIDHKDSSIILQQAVIDPTTGTITFTLHPKSGTVPVPAVAVADPDKVFATGSALFTAPTPGGGGTTGTTDGSCVVSAATDAALKTCIDNSATSFTFENAATITFGADTYVASSWGSSSGNTNEIQYMLQTGGIAGHTTSSSVSEIDLATNGKYDINLDNLDQPNISQFFSSINAAASSGSVNVTFHNYNKEGIESSYDNMKVDSTNINIFAEYSAAQDELATVFQAGGDNETHEIGTYGPGKSLDYPLQNPESINGCTTANVTPNFRFGSNPKTAATNSLMTVNWEMYTSGGTAVCQMVSGNVKVQILAANQSLPAPPVSADQGGSNGPPTCESSGFSLSWLLCPVINGLADGVDDVYHSVVQPLLVTQNINLTDPGDLTNPKANGYSALYTVWSDFRVFGDIFLIIALLVIVFGQSLGGGMIDAYSAKKILPRLLIAAVLINLSIYIVELLVDITNIIGLGINNLISAPFVSSGDYHIQLSGGTGVLGFAALAGVGGTIWVAMAAGGAIAGPALLFLLLFVLIPAFLTIIAILVTVLIRRGLIILLILLSPVAFALYCLPNTERYFRKWWDLLLETLLVYPIIAAVFAIANVLAVTVELGAQSSGIASAIGQLMGIIALIIPLFLIPFAFRIAGGTIGKLHETLTNYRKKAHQGILGNPNNERSPRNRSKGNLAAGFTRGRAQTYRNLKNANGGKGRGGLATALLFGGAVEKEAMLNQASGHRINAVKDNGDDSVLNARASFIDPTDNKRRTLDGKTVGDIDYAASKLQYPNLSDIQKVSEYRSSKINTTEEAHQFERNFGLMAQQQGLSADEATGVFTGLSFAKQSERGELKYGRYARQEDGTFKFLAVGDQGSYAGDPDIDPATGLQKPGGKTVPLVGGRSSDFIKEQYAKRGSYDGARMFSSYFQSMGDIKKTHMDKLDGYDMKVASGGALTKSEQDLYDHSRGQLKQIVEIQDNMERGGQMRDPDTGQMVSSGLAGATPETQAAFQKMKELDAGNTDINSIRAEIANGQTYEKEHSPTMGDFAPGSRPTNP